VLTLYAQPFVSVGRYARLGELAAADPATSGGTMPPRTCRRCARSSTARPRSRSTSRTSQSRRCGRPRCSSGRFTPGSTLFIVWQQLRQGTDTFAQPLHSAAPDVATRPGIHTLAIKLSYWFG